MANVAAGTLWNLPNLDGILFSQTSINTPLTNRISKVRIVDNPEFAMSSSYAHETPAQPAITETASLTAPTAVSHVRGNEKNVTQIYHEKVSISYQKLSSGGRMQFAEVGSTGFAYSTFDGKNPVQDELDFQRIAQMEEIRRKMEKTFFEGAYQLSTASNVAYKTRGLIAASTVNTLDGGAGAISKAKINTILKTMFDNGAPFTGGKLTLFVGSFSKQKISAEYAYVPQSRNEGGEAISTIMTDFCEIEVVAVPSAFLTASNAVLVDMSKLAVVFQPVPGKSTLSDGTLQNVVWEKLAQNGAGEDWQLYLQAGLDYGSAYFHGTITNLATA